MRASSTSSTSTTSTTSSTTSSTSSSRRRGRKGLKAWLLEQVDCGRYPGLRWEEGAGRQLFRLPWKHASKHDYTHADSALFRAWAEHKGRFRAGVDKPDPPGWKTRLRCAMNKSRDFVEEPNRGQADISHPYKVYRVLSQRSAPPPTPAVVSSPCGSLDSHEEDKDTDNGRPRPARMPLYALMGLEEASNRKIEADAMDTNDDVASPPMIGGSAEDPANIDQLEEELGPKASAFRVTVSYRGRQLLCCTVTNSSGCLITSHSACGREPTNGSAALEVTRTHSYARRVAGPATPGNRTPPSHWTPATADGPAPDSAGPVQDESSSSSSPSPLPPLLLPSSSDDCAVAAPVVVVAAIAAAVIVVVALAVVAAAVPPPWHCRPRRRSWTLGTVQQQQPQQQQQQPQPQRHKTTPPPPPPAPPS
ncbi:interferon regulatory factor 9-like [Lethenteron reissneri]|uniref:interferon regulatory factor 9-like n=1 Tax=Lethenteron reissneri TaxID=7753 RepID=UPI002AB5F0F7|nr:interferon regulatory factor 9-like [Lethenteron reissneri]